MIFATQYYIWFLLFDYQQIFLFLLVLSIHMILFLLFFAAVSPDMFVIVTVVTAVVLASLFIITVIVTVTVDTHRS